MVTFVLIPGLLSDARVWAPLADALAPYGSVVHAELGAMESITATASALLAATAGPVVPIGHSLGGRVAFEVARQGGERVVGLVAADTGFDGVRDAEVPVRHERIAWAHRDLPGLVDSWLPPMLAASRRVGELADDLRTMALGVGADAHERQIRALLGRPDAGAYLGSLTCPVLLLTGTEDTWSPVEQHEEMAALLPRAELSVVEGAGHFLPMEAPGVVAEVVTGWLARHSLVA